MKRITPPLLVAFIVAIVLAPFAWAASGSGATASASDQSPAAPLAHTLSTVTGIAISPLLGTSAYGAYQWVRAKDGTARAALPWYAKPSFWLPALLIVAVCAAKDSLGAIVPPVLKKPLDALEVMENKFSGMVAAGAVVPFAMDSFSKLLFHSASNSGGAAHGLAMLPPLGASFAPVLDILTIPFGIAMFVIVWMASHAINVLILLSPWGAIDAGLKTARTALLGLLTLSATINPWVGALLSVVIIVISYFIAGWAFRLTIFGTVMCWDFFTLRRHRFVPAENANLMFSGAMFKSLPVRTYGRLVRREDGALEFSYRPWLVRPVRAVPVTAAPAGLAVGSGMFFSIVTPDAGGTLFLLPPRYRGHEATMAERYRLGGGVRPVGLRKAWTALKEMIGGRATGPAAA